MEERSYQRGFIPYALAAFLVGLVGGFSAVLGPPFVRDIGIAYNNTTWIALSQAISAAACAPVLGKLGDLIGRRRTLLLGLAVYTAGNALTALADTLLQMLLARFVLGIGMAAIAPVVLAYIVTEYPPERIAKGFSLYMLISSGAVVFGPALGSVLIENYGWRVMIWLCTGISAAVLAACVLLRGEGRKIVRKGERFDALGALLVVIFFSLLLFIPSFGQNFGWSSSYFLLVLVGAAISLAGLVTVEKYAENPILSGRFITRRAFVLSVVALFLTQGLMQANMTNTIVFVNYTQPENSVISGYAISIMYVGMSVGSVLLGPLADRYEPKHVLTLSLAVTLAGCALILLFDAQSSVLLLGGSLGVLGLGLGGNGTIFMKLALAGTPRERASAGTGTYGLFRDLAAPFGVAVFVPMFTNRITASLDLGQEAASAAVASVRALALVEIACVAAGIAAVWMLPKIHGEKA